jgi:hypothetical protein
LHSRILRSSSSLLGIGGNVAVERLPLFRHQPLTFWTGQFLTLNLCTPLAQKDGYCEEAIAEFSDRDLLSMQRRHCVPSTADPQPV